MLPPAGGKPIKLPENRKPNVFLMISGGIEVNSLTFAQY